MNKVFYRRFSRLTEWRFHRSRRQSYLPCPVPILAVILKTMRHQKKTLYMYIDLDINSLISLDCIQKLWNPYHCIHLVWVVSGNRHVHSYFCTGRTIETGTWHKYCLWHERESWPWSKGHLVKVTRSTSLILARKCYQSHLDSFSSWWFNFDNAVCSQLNNAWECLSVESIGTAYGASLVIASLLGREKLFTY